MTKKDYQLIADAIKSTPTTAAEVRVLRDVASNIADKLQTDNPRFNRERFLQACGV